MDLLEPWRLRVVLPFVRGRLLDLACGYNNLRRAHRRGGMRPGELDGIRPRDMRALLQRAGLELVREVPFQLGLNRLYVARKPLSS